MRTDKIDKINSEIKIKISPYLLLAVLRLKIKISPEDKLRLKTKISAPRC